ncbi:MAG: hypothetical protein DRJ10_00470, partial [Bacteroidetes bacterium]
MTTEESKEELGYDPLDMNNYKIEKLPVREKTGFEKWMARLGGPLAIITFVLLGFVINIPFLQNISPDNLSQSALKEYNDSEKVFKIVKISDVPEAQQDNFKNIKTKLKKKKKARSLKESQFNTDKLITDLKPTELKVWEQIKSKAFERKNALMLAIFLAAIILWITEAVPNYLTSLILIITLV